MADTYVQKEYSGLVVITEYLNTKITIRLRLIILCSNNVNCRCICLIWVKYVAGSSSLVTRTTWLYASYYTVHTKERFSLRSCM